jgi:hypothetical protein
VPFACRTSARWGLRLARVGRSDVDQTEAGNVESRIGVGMSDFRTPGTCRCARWSRRPPRKLDASGDNAPRKQRWLLVAGRLAYRFQHVQMCAAEAEGGSLAVPSVPDTKATALRRIRARELAVGHASSFRIGSGGGCVSAAAIRWMPVSNLSSREPRLKQWRWMVTFSHRVIESCEVRNDGSASESETLRSSEGKVTQQANSVVITFADDRVERWTAVDKRMVVEHWFPAAAYPAGDKVVGIADRVQQ